MAIIYMSHPVHGAKVATMELEAVYDEENGWTRYTLDTPVIEEEAAPVVNTLEVKRKRGRPAVEVVEQGA
jgi:hypothetical protein